MNLPETIARYLDRMDSSRRGDIARVLDGLTEREVLLVKDAAVMGWVQGMRYHDLRIPGDSKIVTTVVDACLAFPDLYPTLSSPRGDL